MMPPSTPFLATNNTSRFLSVQHLGLWVLVDQQRKRMNHKMMGQKTRESRMRKRRLTFYCCCNSSNRSWMQSSWFVLPVESIKQHDALAVGIGLILDTHTLPWFCISLSVGLYIFLRARIFLKSRASIIGLIYIGPAPVSWVVTLKAGN